MTDKVTTDDSSIDSAASELSAGFGVLPECYPPPHASYLLERNGATFTATPCYGMHDPWWIVRTLIGEAAPSPMLDGDKWSVRVTPNVQAEGAAHDLSRSSLRAPG